MQQVGDFRFTMELYTPTFEELNFIWGTLGGKQLPSVLYQLNLLPLERDLDQAAGPLIQTVHSNFEKPILIMSNIHYTTLFSIDILHGYHLNNGEEPYLDMSLDNQEKNVGPIRLATIFLMSGQQLKPENNFGDFNF